MSVINENIGSDVKTFTVLKSGIKLAVKDCIGIDFLTGESFIFLKFKPVADFAVESGMCAD